jgi:hypothetical protein
MSDKEICEAYDRGFRHGHEVGLENSGKSAEQNLAEDFWQDVEDLAYRLDHAAPEDQMAAIKCFLDHSERPQPSDWNPLSPIPHTMAVLPSADSAAEAPWRAPPTAPVPTSLLPC